MSDLSNIPVSSYGVMSQSAEESTKCPNCRAVSSLEVRFCSSCGLSFRPINGVAVGIASAPAPDLPPSAQPGVTPAKRGTSPIMVVAILAILLLGVYTFFFHDPHTTAKPSTSSPSAKINPLDTPYASLSEMVGLKGTLTDAQWNAYAETLRGKRVISWTGTVITMDKKPFGYMYTMNIDVKEYTTDFTFDVQITLSQADAIRVNMGQTVTFSGSISQVNCVATSCPIEIENATYGFN